MEHPAVGQVAVIGARPALGEGKAFVVPGLAVDEDSSSPGPGALGQPQGARSVEVVDELPLNATGSARTWAEQALAQM